MGKKKEGFAHDSRKAILHVLGKLGPVLHGDVRAKIASVDRPGQPGAKAGVYGQLIPYLPQIAPLVGFKDLGEGNYDIPVCQRRFGLDGDQAFDLMLLCDSGA